MKSFMVGILFSTFVQPVFADDKDIKKEYDIIPAVVHEVKIVPGSYVNSVKYELTVVSKCFTEDIGEFAHLSNDGIWTIGFLVKQLPEGGFCPHSMGTRKVTFETPSEPVQEVNVLGLKNQGY